jgi:hypothetical protein
MSRTAKAQERPPPLQCENTKIVASCSFGRGSAQSMFELLPGAIIVGSQQYLQSVNTLMRHVPIRCASATKIAQ